MAWPAINTRSIRVLRIVGLLVQDERRVTQYAMRPAICGKASPRYLKRGLPQLPAALILTLQRLQVIPVGLGRKADGKGPE